MTETEVLHDARQRYFSYLYCEMCMVGEKRKSVDPMPEPLYAFLQQKAESAAIYVVEEDVLLRIPADDHMVVRTRIMDP